MAHARGTANSCRAASAQNVLCDGSIEAIWPNNSEPVLGHLDQVSKSVVGEARVGHSGLGEVGIGGWVGEGRHSQAVAPKFGVELERLVVAAVGASGTGTG